MAPRWHSKQWVTFVRSRECGDALGYGFPAPVMPYQAAAIEDLRDLILSSFDNKITSLLGSPFILAQLILDC